MLSWRGLKRSGFIPNLKSLDIVRHEVLPMTDRLVMPFAPADDQALWRALAETLPQIVWIADGMGKVRYLNSRWFTYTGRANDALTGLPWDLVIHPDDLAAVGHEFKASVVEGRSFALKYRLRRFDGVYRWFDARSAKITGTPDADSLWIGTAADIHEQYEAHATILSLRQRTESIIQDAPILLWVVDEKGTFTYYEGKVKKFLGIAAEDRIGKNILELYDGRDEIAGNVRRALAGETVVGESRIGDVCLENKFTPQYDASGKINGVLGLSVDVTQRKIAEQARADAAVKAQAAAASSRLKSEFLATMSHEIRTPINGVLGMASLLTDTQLNVEQREYADGIRRSGEGLLALINDILDFSKIEAGKLDFEDKPLSVAAIVADLEASMRFIAESKRLTLRSVVAPDLPSTLVGDPGRFRQVLLNLLGNALKFTADGGVAINVSVADRSVGGCIVRVEVVDSGIGVTPKIAADLFQPFTQGDASTARRYGGTGLGLSICKGLVDRVGGKIGVTSQEGVGSTFWFTWAFAEAPLATVAEGKLAPVKADARIASVRILIAEDNPINQLITSKIVEKLGFQAFVVANGRLALEALAASNYDLILMDCHMPEVDGYEATERIRASTELPNPRIPIIAVTANAMRGDAEKCLEHGMTDYLSKPFNSSDLRAIILKHLKVKSGDEAA